MARGVVLAGVEDRHAESIGLLLPAMVCGEESAAIVFDNERCRLSQTLFDESHRVLGRISREEEVHERLLKSIGEHVPSPVIERELRREARRYFMRMKSDDIALHFSRIAWLDSAVCVIFAELTRRGSPLRRAARVQAIFRKILVEEASHTAFSRRYVARMGGDVRGDDESFHLVREGLVELLRPCAPAFDALEVDPDGLFARLTSR